MKWFGGSGATRPDGRPWSPATLTLLSLFFGLGAVVVSIQNLQRMGVIDARLARFYFWSTVVLLASILLLIWSLNPQAFAQSPAQQVAPISVASPLAVFFMQIFSFQKWRTTNPTSGTRPWFTALTPVIAMTIVTVFLAVISIQVFAVVFNPA